MSEGLIRSGELEGLWAELRGPRTEAMCKESIRFRKKALRTRLWPSERKLRKVKLISLHVSMYRSAFERVNGFDENYVGWGRADEDLGLRLQLAGIRGRTVADRARVLHLHHEPLPRPVSGDLSSSYNEEYYVRPRRRKYWPEKGFRKAGERS